MIVTCCKCFSPKYGDVLHHASIDSIMHFLLILLLGLCSVYPKRKWKKKEKKKKEKKKGVCSVGFLLENS